MSRVPANTPDAPERAQRCYAINGQRVAVEPLPRGLHVVATPIGNLGDVTLRALAALAGADLIACEDTRVTRKLLNRYAIVARLTPYHDHNAVTVRPALLRRLSEGAAIALVSDAGTPLVSDPGFKLVRAAQEAGHRVTTLPGASAVLAALTVSGLPSDRFLFAGFLPPKQAARRARIAELAGVAATIVLFEAGPRLGATLADLSAGWGRRQAALCRELTKLHEEVRAGDLASLAQSCAGEAVRGEIVLVIAPAQPAEEISPAETETLLRAALSRASVKDAVAEIAAATGLPRRQLYQHALSLNKQMADAAGRASDR